MASIRSSSSRTTFADVERGALEDGVAKLQRMLRDVRALDAKTIKERRDDRLETLQKRVNNLLADLLGMGSPDYAKYKLKPIDGELDTTFGDHYSMDEYREAVKEGLAKAAGRIEETITAMKAAMSGDAAPAPVPKATPAPPPPATAAPTAAPRPTPTSAPAPAPTAAPAPRPTPAPTPATTAAPTPMKSHPPASSSASGRILVLGNSDAGAGAAELLAQLGVEFAVIDSPSVESLDSVRDAGYAIVVGTEGGDGAMLAIGFLLALLGRSRIALLSNDIPAALAGCVQVPMDDDGLWRLLLAREMKKAGLEVDLNRAL